ncbi:MAG: hypothetical protein JSR58_07515 [Verrucomicrobia bacterium]|nr:hypothetical protein [Verrucomicrobiota bacterium]
MKKILMVIAVFCMSFSTDYSQKAKPATIKVLVEKGAEKVLLDVKGRHHVYNPDDGSHITSHVTSRKHPVTVEEYGLRWGEKFPGTYRLRFVPGDSTSTILVNGIEYKGCVELHSIEGKLFVINEVDVETYIKSILTAQFAEPRSEEVMNAIAIIARTNVYYLLSKNMTSIWHLDGAESHFEGAALLGTKPHVDHAVEVTRHAIMTLNGNPFPATWSEDSAGQTVDFATMLRKPALVPNGVNAPIAARERKHHMWSFTTSKENLAKVANLPHIQAIDLYLIPQTTKVYGAKLKCSGSSNDVDFITLQKVLGSQRLRSNDFTVTSKGDQLVFTGYGDGLSVGLCLFSAEALAKKGEKASDMLASFFPSTQLEKVRALAVDTK